MLVAATRENEESEWYIKTFTKMVGAHRVDQADWTEEDALDHELYTDDIKPFTPKPELTKYKKYGIATVEDGRVVWPVLEMSQEEIAVVDKSEAAAQFANIQCAAHGCCMVIPVLDELFATGTISIDNLPADVVTWYNDMKALKAQIEDG